MNKAIKKENTFEWFYSKVKKLAEKEFENIPKGFVDYPWFKWMIDCPKGTPAEAFEDYKYELWAKDNS